jgi:hypothetical protein
MCVCIYVRMYVFVYILYVCTYVDRLCGLVVRVPGYRYRGPGFDYRALKKSNGSGTGSTQPREYN